jgi:plasmid stabilization system protein ParE
MAQVIYSDEAFTDFERIIEFLPETSPQAAAQALDGIRSAIGILEAHPYIGRRVDDEIRELVISREATGHLALYRLDPAFDVVRILRIRHQREAGYRD